MGRGHQLMTMMIGQTSAADDGFVLEEFEQPLGSRSVSCQNAGGCTATWSFFATGSCSSCPRWYNPANDPALRTWHFKWNFGSCTQNQAVPINTWTLMDQTFSWKKTCSNPNISNCSDTINVSHDGGSTIHGTFTFSCFCDASP